VIRLEKLAKTYETEAGDVHALRNLDLEIRRGEFVAIMGQSGSGKTTLMNILGCLDRPTSGTYWLEGHDVGRLAEDVRARLRGTAFGFVFQSYNLLPRMSAIEQVELPLIYQRVSNRRRRALEALDRVGLIERRNHQPQQLSGGEQQRVAIARSLVVEPLLVLADEPTGALDTKTGDDVMRLFGELVEDDITVVIVTHEKDVAAHASRLLQMRDGALIDDRPNRAQPPRQAPTADPTPLRASS
jgi:putative ABC transport system ATP-binding protein